MGNCLDGDRDALRRYVRLVADDAGLREWELALSDDPPAEAETGAEVAITYGRRHALIRISPSWSEWDDDLLRYVVIHELIHCHLEPMHWALNNAQSALGMPSFAILEGAFLDAMEIGVDGLAMAWAKQMPLPEVA